MAAVARDHWAGAAPVYGARIRRALGIPGDDMAAVLKMLQVDPAFPHEYARLGCALVDARRGLFWLEDCDALADEPPRGWLDVLDDPAAPGLDAVVGAVNPRARCRPLDPAAVQARGVRPRRAWSIEIEDANAPFAESPWARAPRACSIAEFVFRPKPVRETAPEPGGCSSATV